MTTVSSSLGAGEPCFLFNSSPATIHQQSYLDQDSSYRQSSSGRDRVRKIPRVRKGHAKRIVRHRKPALPSHSAWGHGDEDERRLAADPSVILPSDHRPKKPRLERQEAFREPNQIYHSDTIDDDAELYKLGILYDDEHVRGSRFSLDTIVHTEPVYSIRPARRARKQRRDMSYLHLDLSFASLGSDLDIQHYLAPDLALLTPPPEAAPIIKGPRKDDTAFVQLRRDTTLATIRELPESPAHSFTPFSTKSSQFPELISDDESEKDDDEEAQDWAMLDTADILSTAGSDAETTKEDFLDAASTADDAWIVLGDGS